MTDSPSKPSTKNCLIVVAKRPAPGNTKTRLSPPLDPRQAAGLYECFLLDVLDLVRRLGDIHPILAYTPVEEAAYFQQAAPDFECIPQQGASLGERLDNVLVHYLNAGYSCVAVMNSDSPTLPLSSLAETFVALSGNNDVVLGPCDDGGYYLIGLKRPHPDLLRQVKMSTPHVLSDTLHIAKKMKLRVHLLPTWYDVDDPPSLEKLSSELDGQNPQSRTAFHTRSFLKSIAESFSEFSDDH